MRRLAQALLLAVALWPTAGCYNPFDPRELGAGISSPPPVPDSPSNVLRLLEWTYNYRAIAEYREIFTDDYRFGFSKKDPYGEAYRGDTWTREDELISATHLFQGGSATEPAATSITLHLDTSFKEGADPRPGKGNRWHRTIHTSVSLTISDPTKKTLVNGFANFYLCRGDSAAIPQELKDKGFRPDSTRWYVERWDDDTAVGSAAARLAPAQGLEGPAPRTAFDLHLSWGALKVAYR